MATPKRHHSTSDGNVMIAETSVKIATSRKKSLAGSPGVVKAASAPSAIDHAFGFSHWKKNASKNPTGRAVPADCGAFARTSFYAR